MTNAFKGAALGGCVAFAIATLVAMICSCPHDNPEMMLRGFGAVFLIGGLGAVPVGAGLGVLAGKLRDQRLLVLEIIVLSLVPMAGFAVFRALGVQHDIFDRHNADSFIVLVMLAAAPAAIATVILEWWTRPRIASPRF